jgi:polysaccharide pyruvyl transferase WcaK-like protein
VEWTGRLPADALAVRGLRRRVGRRPAVPRPTAGTDADVDAVLGALDAADAFVLAGRGGSTDAFLHDGLATAHLLAAAQDRGVPTAVLGHGAGPLHDPDLKRLTFQALGGADLLTLREGRHAPGWLRSVGLTADAFEVVGDEALDLALGAADAAAGDALGVNVRRHDYAGVGDAEVRQVATAVARLQDELGCRVLGVPVSVREGDGDAAVLADALGDLPGLDPGHDVQDVGALVARAGRCRAVVTGSYHAAIFALAQGVPVVGLWASPYYEGKVEGLAERFPGGVRSVRLGDEDTVERLVAAAHAAWDEPAGTRTWLMDTARAQAAAAQDAFDRFAALVERRA